MQNRDLGTLEFSAVLERLAGRTAFSASEDLARRLRPSSEPDQIVQWQRETREARELLQVDANKGIGAARDVRGAAREAQQGKVLDPAALLDVKYTLISARTLSRFFTETESQYPSLREIASALAADTGLISRISRILDDRGEIKSDASATLSAIRRDLKIARERLSSRMESMLADPKIASMLQEAIVTQREGRFVLPLRAEFKGRLEGVVHDRSTSGATLFVEPLKMVELNNQVRELELAERDEMRRILAELSQSVGRLEEEIADTVQALAELDLAFAKAKFALELDASEPRFADSEESKLKLLSARHPLLDPETVVAIDIVLQEGVHSLVITGPNTGGKTVTLKTVGLLSLMAQSGLQISAETGSILPVFTSVYADIGDEQSIEQSLSTFSAHISNIVRILGEADRHSLVLLDELGAGTDPQEGAVLAQAIMDWLVARKITALIATHFPELKAYATATPGVVNASVEFDLETLQPTFHLSVGIPGRSNALAIASRLGLDPEIIETARAGISPEDLRIDELLDQIRQENEIARRTRFELEQQRNELKKSREKLDQRLEGIAAERGEVLEQAQARAAEELDALQGEVERLRRKLERTGQPLKEVEKIDRELERLKEAVEEPAPKVVKPSKGEVNLGDLVLLESLGAHGTVIAIDREDVEVQVGRLRVRARTDELTRLDREPEPQAEAHVGRFPEVEPQPMEFEIRGMVVEEALELLERRLDAAFLAGMPFLRVIHGKGTGRLREAVRAFLQSNEYVQSFEPGGPAEGGDGVTVVHLAV